MDRESFREWLRRLCFEETEEAKEEVQEEDTEEKIQEGESEAELERSEAEKYWVDPWESLSR